MNQKITDIFKEKYGIANIPASINITPKDTLFTTYRKIAKFIYKGVRYDSNYNIDPNEELAAIQAKEQDEKIEPVNFSDANFPSSIKHNLSKFYKFKSDDWTKHIYKSPVIDKWNKRIYKELINDNNKKTQFFIVDPDNSSIKYDNQRYLIGKKSEPKILVTKINQDLLIGYNRLTKDMIKEFENSSKQVQSEVDTSMFTEIIDNLHNQTDRKYLNWGIYFDHVAEDWRKWAEANNLTLDDIHNNKITYKDSTYTKDKMQRHLVANRCIAWIQNYMDSTYNLTLQYKYEREHTLSSHAKFYQTKKNINQETQQEMLRLSNSWSKYVQKVEIDNDVDLDKLNKLKPELMATFKVLPVAENGKKPTLRFRKLKNHKALGIFTPVNNTIAVDFRPDDGGGIGLQSFIHEYGHFLDFNNTADTNRSLSNKFKPILKQTQQAISALSAEQLGTGKKHGIPYLSTPTEVYARGFELYTHNLGLNNSLLKDAEYNTDVRYTTFSKDTRKRLFSYFDEEFPDLKDKIQTLIKDKESSQEHQQENNLDAQNNSKLASDPKTFNHAEQLDLFSTENKQVKQQRYRYYSTSRPIDIGTYPKNNQKPTSIVNYDNRQDVGNGIKAWGYVEYSSKLTEQEISDYELTAKKTENMSNKQTKQISNKDLPKHELNRQAYLISKGRLGNSTDPKVEEKAKAFMQKNEKQIKAMKARQGLER